MGMTTPRRTYPPRGERFPSAAKAAIAAARPRDARGRFLPVAALVVTIGEVCPRWIPWHWEALRRPEGWSLVPTHVRTRAIFTCGRYTGPEIVSPQGC